MTPLDREHYYDCLYFQAIHTSINFNLNKNFFEFNSNKTKQKYWRPIAGVGEITDAQFIGNYMIDSDKSQRPQPTSEFSLKPIKQLSNNAHYMDISEHRALVPDKRLSHICISHMESLNLVYIMLENDYKRAIKLLELMKYIDTIETQELLRPIENRLCAIKNNNQWLRGRCQLVSADKQVVKVRYIDWGNTVNIKTKDIRRLPNEFYQESACCLPCRLDGIDDITFDNKMFDHCSEILIGSDRGQFDLDMIVTRIGKMNEFSHIVLYRKSINLNDEIYNYLPSHKNLSEEEYLIEQFTHELPLISGEHYRALLSSFTGKDNSFYILIDNNNYNEVIDQVLNQITDDDPSPILIRPFMMISVKYDGKYTRAWIKTIDNDQCQIFYVDWGNEEKVMKNNIRMCPESIRYIPWLANRVKFHNEQLTREEFDEFWKTIENDYCQVFLIDQYMDYYSIEIKYDYLNMIRKRRAILFITENF